MGRPERPEIGLGRPKIEPFEAESTQQERQGQPDQASRPAKTRQAARLIAKLSARTPQLDKLGRASGNFVIDMPATRLKLQQAFDQSPALKPESSIKTRIQH